MNKNRAQQIRKKRAKKAEQKKELVNIDEKLKKEMIEIQEEAF